MSKIVANECIFMSENLVLTDLIDWHYALESIKDNPGNCDLFGESLHYLEIIIRRMWQLCASNRYRHVINLNGWFEDVFVNIREKLISKSDKHVNN